MKFCKNNFAGLCVSLLAMLLNVACDGKPEFEEPSFLHVEAIKVAQPAGKPVGYNTANVGTCYVVALYSGSNAEEEIGVFELPFTVPVLFNGEAQYIRILPAVNMSGVSGLRHYYPFYRPIELTSGTVLPGGDTLHLNLGRRDTLWIDTVTTSYNAIYKELIAEFFEPTQGNILFDSVVQWVNHDASQARSGLGCGKVHIGADQSHIDFQMTERCKREDDPTVALYLELDYKGNKRLSVEMRSAVNRGGNESTEEVATINPTDEWKKLYINLGTAWRYFNLNPEFRIAFSVLNAEGTEGDIWLDNIKVISTAY